MIGRPRLVAVTLVAVIAASAGMVGLSAAPASALEPASGSTVQGVGDPGDPDGPPKGYKPPKAGQGLPKGVSPSKTRLRSWMLNVSGGVLGKAFPHKWRAEQVANQFRYNHSFEALKEAVYGSGAEPQWPGDDGVVRYGKPGWNPGAAVPETVADFTLREPDGKEWSPVKNGGKGGRAYTPPATKSGKFTKALKGAGGAIAALTGYQFGVGIGKGITGLFGVDSDGVVCGATDVVGRFLAFATSADCSQVVNGLTPEQRNQDISLLSALGDCAPAAMDRAALISGVKAGDIAPFCGAVGVYSSSDELLGVGVVDSVSLSHSDGKFTLGVHGDGFAEGGHGVILPEVQCYSSAGDLLGAAQVGIPIANGPAVGTLQINGCDGSGLEFVLLAVAGGKVGLVSVDGGVFVGPGVDPGRWITCTIHGSDGNDYTAKSDTFHESDDVIPTPVCPDLPDGVTPETVTFSEDGAGLHHVLSVQQVTDAYKDQMQDFPGCSTGGCGLDLLLIDGTDKTSCFDLGAGDDNPCKSWFDDPDRDTKYECEFGGVQVAISNCYVYSGLFDPARRKAGAAYSDPTTGEWSGGQNSPTEAQDAMGTALQSPDAPRGCDVPATTGFDPIGWVMRPVQCALEWAFVPAAATVRVSMEGTKEAWQETTPGQISTAVKAWKIAPEVGGCKSDLPFPVPLVGKTITVPVIDACPGSPIGSVAGWVRGIVTVSLGITAAFACKRIIAGWVDYR